MRKGTAIAVAITSLVATILWHFEINTGAADARPDTEFVVGSDPYLPIQNLEPAY